MLSIRPSIRRIACATFFIVLGALPSTADVIEVTASGGPGANGIDGYNSVQVEVIGSANVVFDYSFNGGAVGGYPACTPIDASQPYGCTGGLSFYAQFSVPFLRTADEIDGLYQNINGFNSNNIEPNDYCNGNFQGSGTMCALTLGPGTYELFAQFSDFWTAVPTNAIAGMLPAESVTATLTVNSGTVVVLPGPTTQNLALLGGVLLSALIIRSRLYSPAAY